MKSQKIKYNKYRKCGQTDLCSKQIQTKPAIIHSQTNKFLHKVRLFVCFTDVFGLFKTKYATYANTMGVFLS